jgi:hypothetical protein
MRFGQHARVLHQTVYIWTMPEEAPPSIHTVLTPSKETNQPEQTWEPPPVCLLPPGNHVWLDAADLSWLPQAHPAVKAPRHQLFITLGRVGSCQA